MLPISLEPTRTEHTRLEELTTKPPLLTIVCHKLYLQIFWFMKIGLWKWNFFGLKEIFFMTFDLKNGCKNEFEDNNEKLYSWSRNRVSHKIDLKAVWPRNGHADSVEVNSFWPIFAYRNFRQAVIQFFVIKNSSLLKLVVFSI